MMQTIPHKTKQFFFVLIKISIVIVAFYFIYNKLINNKELNFSDLIKLLIKNDVFSLKNSLIILFLTCFNWIMEILKWQNLVKPWHALGFKDAMKQSLSALTISIITPNRIGEYGAKVLYYNKESRKRILLLNFLGNMSQMFVTTVFGSIGLVVFSIHYAIKINFYKPALFLIIGLLLIVLTRLFFKKNKLKLKGFSIEKLKQFLLNYPKKNFLLVIWFSLVRYTLFTFQFYFLLHILGVKLSYFTAIIPISSMYLITSIIPTINIFDLVIKGSVGVYLFKFLGVNPVIILVITTTMWLLNFALPSVIGSYFVLNFNSEKNKIDI